MPGALPWGPFYWDDWRNEIGLRRSSFAARGLWMDCLCIAARCDPPGYLAVNGEALSTTDIARMTGGSETEVSTLLDELFRNGVPSRTRNGIIYSRRMVRDAKRARTARENGKKGGNPSISKQRVSGAWVNPPVNPEVKPSHERVLESESEREPPVVPLGKGERQTTLFEEPPAEPAKRTRRRKPQTPIPPDWQPTEEGLDFARQQGFVNGQIPKLIAKHVNWWIGSGILKADWDAVWRNSVIREAEMGKAAKPVGQPKNRL